MEPKELPRTTASSALPVSIRHEYAQHRAEHLLSATGAPKAAKGAAVNGSI